jgi:pyruvate,water dikinase
MVPAKAAGVAFTANPLTGARDEATISAVRGLGERLVSGEAVAEEWVVRGVGAGAEAVCQRSVEHALTMDQALAVAAIARRIERDFGAPQDIEWAIDADGRLFMLQARPMTALPESEEPGEAITWKSPVGGGWMRNFRLGEWLPEPVTPLCESWLLACIEEGEVSTEERDFGLRPRPPYHVLAHGWYFSSPIAGGLPLRGVVTALTRHPRQIAALALSTTRPDLAERPFIAPVARRWQHVLLPRYQQLVATSEAHFADSSSPDLIRAVDAVATLAGEYLWALSVVGGHAWKAEHALARFCRKHLPERAAHSHQDLLLGLPVRLPTPYPAAPAHAVQSLDWIRPTLGETSPSPLTTGDLPERRTRLAEERRAAEAACRKALAGRPRLRRRFDQLLALAQRYAILREEQASWFTLGWPFMRRAVLRLGEELQRQDAVTRADDVFFLARTELVAHVSGSTGRSAVQTIR